MLVMSGSRDTDTSNQPWFTRHRKDIAIMESVHQSLRRQGLVRPRDGRLLGGVCAGLGRRFGIDPWPARLLFVLILITIPGSQILLYPILWILMPSEEAPVAAGPTSSVTTPFPPAPAA
jgi:phage shock protein PspC (stress-responsive transcriptional regulator)